MRSIGVTNFKYSSSAQSPFSSFQYPNEKETTTTTTTSLSSRISPLILLVIIVLAVIFFVYGLIHLVLWFLVKRPSPSSLYSSNRFQEATTRTRALQRQLQQLFRMHDSGLDQALIDALPLFYYHDLLGLNEPFDCAVCLSEFSEQDKLRLVPMCSHAFHMNCLDTWLLSNSTCPLCRASLSNVENNPIFYNNIDNNNNNNNNNSLTVTNRIRDEDENVCLDSQSQRVFSVRLGKFRNNGLKNGEGIGNSSSGCSLELDERRCYSMGSYQYVVRDDSILQVVLSQSHDVLENENIVEGKRIGNRTQGESFSVSKIWLWSNKTKFHGSNAPFP